MNFELDETQAMMRGGIRSLLDGEADIRRVRAVAYDGNGQDPSLWQALARDGWLSLVIPEEEGGTGQGFEDAAIVLMEAGRALLHLPLSTTILATRSITRSSVSPFRSDLLRRVADGQASVTLALRGSPEDWNGEREDCSAEQTGKSWRLYGMHWRVPFGPLADAALVEARLPTGGRGLFVVPTRSSGIDWIELNPMDRSIRQYDLALDGVNVKSEASLFGTADARAEIEALLDEHRAVLAAETLGAAERLLELTVDYAKVRMTFGHPIGSYQAVKVRVSEMAAAVEKMRAGVYYAALKIDEGAEDRALAVAMAKAVTSELGPSVATQAIHVHGGIGFTWESDVHLYFKRIKSNELQLGDSAASLERVARHVL